MRRMNYNPFETPFASGEVDENAQHFLLDNNLESGIYFVDVYFDYDSYSITTTIKIDISKPSCTSIISSPGYLGEGFSLAYDMEGLNKLTIYTTNNISLTGSTITLYKIA